MKNYSFLFFLIINFYSVVKPTLRLERLKQIIKGNLRHSIKDLFKNKIKNIKLLLSKRKTGFDQKNAFEE